MSKGLIYTNRTTLENKAMIVFRQSVANSKTERDEENGITIISDDYGVSGVNIDNPNRFFSIKDGVHLLSNEQADWLENSGFIIDRIFYWFVAGIINELKPHPKSDKLFVLKVNIGLKEVQIVTNALNVKPGSIVVVARAGAILPNTNYIKKVKIMGVESEGQLIGNSSMSLVEKSINNGGVIILNQNNYKPGDEFVF